MKGSFQKLSDNKGYGLVINLSITNAFTEYELFIYSFFY